MSHLFKKAACFTDLHVGARQNSKIHNDDCIRFVEWFIAEAKARDCETCIFLGDWSHHRASINVASMNVSIKLLKMLNNNFEKVYFITGNHDLYFKDKRDLNSVEYARDLPNFVMVDDIFIQDDVAIIPWLVGDEWKRLSQIKVRYMFGHLELPYFKMNAMIEMPDHGGLQGTHLSGPEYVFSGHFHKRQYRNNIHYIGNAFPHNYADVDDVDRGAMFLEWGGSPTYVNWAECPKYKVFTLSEMLDNHATLLDAHTHARVKLNIDITYEEANFIRDHFHQLYNVRELQLIPVKEEHSEFDTGEVRFESVDQIVINQLSNIQSDSIDRNLLIEIYQHLDTH